MQLHILEHGSIDAVGAEFVDEAGVVEQVDVTWPVRCYLLVHEAGVLVWDTGLPEADLIADPWARHKWKMAITSPLVPWLAEFGLSPADVTHLGFSHLHLDHAGNAGLFPDATVLLSAREHAHAFGPTINTAYHVGDYAMLQERPTVLVDIVHDVFDDGTVVIHAAPGHTPGHQVLALTLPEPGPVLLVGDACYGAEDLVRRRVARWSIDVAESFRTLDRVEQLAAATAARMLIHHDSLAWGRPS
jgi:N-acyl homoserine lactone hydrolase